MRKVIRFIKYSKNKKLLCWALLYSARYRHEMLTLDSTRMKEKWGQINQESVSVEPYEVYTYAARVGYAVDRICTRTIWESKCLVRALTAQKLLKRKKIDSTLYLGCKMEGEKMVAHAWLRCGEMYVTGGNGEGYGIVSKFSAFK